MVQNSRVKNFKDIEAAHETIVNNTSFSNISISKSGIKDIPSVSTQQLNEENFETFIEKKK